MIRTAIIREARVRNSKGQDCYECTWADDGQAPCTLRVAPRGRDYVPYAVDDVVMVALPGGDHTAGRIIGLYEAAQVEPQDEGNTEMHARGDGSFRVVATGGRVDLGKGDPGDQEQVGLHGQLRADIDALHDLLGADLSTLLALIQIAITAGGGGTFPTTAWDTAQGLAAPDSKAADNVYAKAVA